MTHPLSRRLAAEFIGTAFLLATVVGSGIMAEGLSGGNIAIALLGNTIPTGAILVVLITLLGPISGAHFNPAVTLVFTLRRSLKAHEAGLYALAQVAGGLAGVLLAHVMFAEEILQISLKERAGLAQLSAEWLATFGLLVTILVGLRSKADAIPWLVGLYITAAYWFTASTSFANPAVTIARGFSDTFAGIRPIDIAPFIAAQLIGALAAHCFDRWMFSEKASAAADVQPKPQATEIAE